MLGRRRYKSCARREEHGYSFAANQSKLDSAHHGRRRYHPHPLRPDDRAGREQSVRPVDVRGRKRSSGHRRSGRGRFPSGQPGPDRLLRGHLPDLRDHLPSGPDPARAVLAPGGPSAAAVHHQQRADGGLHRRGGRTHARRTGRLRHSASRRLTSTRCAKRLPTFRHSIFMTE